MSVNEKELTIVVCNCCEHCTGLLKKAEAEVKQLKALLPQDLEQLNQYAEFRKIRAERDALRVEVENSHKAFDSMEDSFMRCSKLLTEAGMKNKSLWEQFNLWKAENKTLRERVQELEEALRFVAAKQPEAVQMLIKNKFVFAGKGGHWEKLAFTFYTDLCELHSKAEHALSIPEGER